jgi:hypothetical protein
MWHSFDMTRHFRFYGVVCAPGPPRDGSVDAVDLVFVAPFFAEDVGDVIHAASKECERRKWRRLSRS